MRIINSYLFKEITKTWVALLFLLGLVTIGLFFGDTLSDVARGKVPTELLFSQLGLRAVESLTILIPLSLFLAVLLTYGRLYRDNEMMVLAATGFGPAGLHRPVVSILLPVVVLLAALALWLSPWAARTGSEMLAEAQKNVSIAGLRPGRFQEFASHESVVYVGRIEPDGNRFEDVFVHIARDDRRDVITAERGFQYQEGGAKYLALLDGFRSEGIPGTTDYRLIRFGRNDVRMPDFEKSSGKLELSARPSESLFTEASTAARAELHWRYAPPLAALVLCLLAIPLSRTSPRQGFYGNVVIAILVYVIYANLLAVGRSWLDEEEIPMKIGLWWVHGLVVLGTLALWRPWRSWRRRRA